MATVKEALDIASPLAEELDRAAKTIAAMQKTEDQLRALIKGDSILIDELRAEIRRLSKKLIRLESLVDQLVAATDIS